VAGEVSADDRNAELERLAAERRELIAVAFRRVFGTEGRRSTEQEVVMTWLAGFCRKRETTWVRARPDASAHLEGRREVLIEIERRISPTPRTMNDVLGLTKTEDNHGPE
jgi:hypothetical protein